MNGANVLIKYIEIGSRSNGNLFYAKSGKEYKYINYSREFVRKISNKW